MNKVRYYHHEELSPFHIISVVAQTCVQLKCESVQYRRTECVFDGLNEDSRITSIDVNEQYSMDMCIKGKSFDVLTPGKMWVDGGCRATFKICSIECKFYCILPLLCYNYMKKNKKNKTIHNKEMF
jgi:hypothetical protein